MFLPEYVFYADFSPFINCETCSGSRIRTNRFKNQMGTHVRIKDFKIKKKNQMFFFPLNVCMLLQAKLCQTLWDLMDCSPPGSSFHGIFQARILERVTTSYSRVSSQPRDCTHIPALVGRFFITVPPEMPLFQIVWKESKPKLCVSLCPKV